LAAIAGREKLELGIPDAVRESSEAYLVVALENNDADRVHEDVEKLAALLDEWGALDGYVLEGSAARKLIKARENTFWAAKAIGVDDLIEVVIPRASMPQFFRKARDLALAVGAVISGRGHAGDGNVHGARRGVVIGAGDGPAHRCEFLPRVDEDAGEELGQRLVPVQRQDVGDVLVRPDDDDAARLAVDTAQVEDVAGLRVGAEHLLVVDQAERALPG
jgi:hypothetical protein